MYTETLTKFVPEAIRIKKARDSYTFSIKLRYSEKATNIAPFSTYNLTLLSNVK